MSTEIDKISLISLWGDHCHELFKIHVTFRNPNMISGKKKNKKKQETMVSGYRVWL